MAYILHLYHPDGPCKRFFFHSRVQAMKRAQSWVAEHFADRQTQFLKDIMAETDYFNPVYMAEVGEVPDGARYIVRLGQHGINYVNSEAQAWSMVDKHAIAQKFPANYLSKLHDFLLLYGYEERVNVLFYPIEWGD